MLSFVSPVKIFVLRSFSASHLPLSTLDGRRELDETLGARLSDAEHKPPVIPLDFIRTQRALELCSYSWEKYKCSLRLIGFIQSENIIITSQ